MVCNLGSYFQPSFCRLSGCILAWTRPVCPVSQRYAEGGRLYNCLTNFFYKIILRLKQVIFSTINIVLLASTNLQSVVFVFHAGKCKICFPKSRIEYMRERAGSGCILFRVLQLKLLFILLLWCVGHPQKPTRVQSWFQLKHCTPQTNTGEYFLFDSNVI